MAESEEELKNFLMKVKQESEKVGLKLNIQKTKIMESDPITSWQIDGEMMETVTEFILGGFQINHCRWWLSHEIKRCLLLERKAMTNLKSILKSRDITLSTKISLVKAMAFPSSHAWMWELDYKESWEWKNWCFLTVVLEKTLESPMGFKEIQPVHPKGNQSWIFIGRTDAEAETPILWPPDVKELTHWQRPWCLERRKAGWEGDDRGRDDWMALPIQWTWVWVSSGSWWWTGKAGTPQSIGSQRVRHNWATELNWSRIKGLCVEWSPTYLSNPEFF